VVLTNRIAQTFRVVMVVDGELEWLTSMVNNVRVTATRKTILVLERRGVLSFGLIY